MKKINIALIVILAGLWLSPLPAMAQSCESASQAKDDIKDLMKDVTDYLNDFYHQELNFSKKKVETSRKEVDDRLDSFGNEITAGLPVWWRDHFLPSLKDMTKQLHVAKVEQTMRIGMMMDAQMVNETIAVLQKHQIDGKNNLALNEETCKVDGLQSLQTKAAGISGGVAAAWGQEQSLRGLNTVMDDKKFERDRGLIGTAYAASPEPDIAGAAALGNAATRREMWKEYVKYFCDPARGDQGCSEAGDQPGDNRAITDLLWGEKQSIALDNADNRRKVSASQRYMLTPRVFNPIKFPLVNSIAQKATPEATEEMFRRRAWAARLNAVNNTVGRMLGERVVSTDKTVAAELLGSAGLIAASTNGSSYREIQEAMSRGRYQDPEFLARMVADPKQLLQEQSTINGMKMQQMNDIFHRMEEMVFMEASMFASDLDRQIPRSTSAALPTQ